MVTELYESLKDFRGDEPLDAPKSTYPVKIVPAVSVDHPSSAPPLNKEKMEVDDTDLVGEENVLLQQESKHFASSVEEMQAESNPQTKTVDPPTAPKPHRLLLPEVTGPMDYTDLHVDSHGGLNHTLYLKRWL